MFGDLIWGFESPWGLGSKVAILVPKWDHQDRFWFRNGTTRPILVPKWDHQTQVWFRNGTTRPPFGSEMGPPEIKSLIPKINSLDSEINSPTQFLFVASNWPTPWQAPLVSPLGKSLGQSLASPWPSLGQPLTSPWPTLVQPWPAPWSLALASP